MPTAEGECLWCHQFWGHAPDCSAVRDGLREVTVPVHRDCASYSCPVPDCKGFRGSRQRIGIKTAPWPDEEVPEKISVDTSSNDDGDDDALVTSFQEAYADALERGGLVAPGVLPPEVEYMRGEGFVAEPLRETVLKAAIHAINGDRNHTYGDPIDDFTRASEALTALGYRKMTPGTPVYERLEPHDISIIQIVVKLSRLAETPRKRDSWVDIAGYAGCGAEVAEEEA